LRLISQAQSLYADTRDRAAWYPMISPRTSTPGCPGYPKCQGRPHALGLRLRIELNRPWSRIVSLIGRGAGEDRPGLSRGSQSLAGPLARAADTFVLANLCGKYAPEALNNLRIAASLARVGQSVVDLQHSIPALATGDGPLRNKAGPLRKKSKEVVEAAGEA
jgi:hypothetical protein